MLYASWASKAAPALGLALGHACRVPVGFTRRLRLTGAGAVRTNRLFRLL